MINNQTLIKLVKEDEKLSKTETATFKKGVSHNVKAGVGASYEEDTLDLYENEFMWELRETNAEV